jgi:multicomponent Na+:H+ antiporter subunit C
MSQVAIYSVASMLLFGIGLYSLIVHPHLLRKILALNVMASGIFLFLVSVARRNWNVVADPVPHAMVLTGIVVAVSTTAFALAIARHIQAETGETFLGEHEEDDRS